MVTIYSATWCAYCHAAKNYLDSIKVPYTDKDVEKEAGAAEESVTKSNQMGIPVIDINGTIIVGFDKPKIDQALKDNKLI
jgi:glutaredoxin 3